MNIKLKSKGGLLFSNRALLGLMIPLIIESFLGATIGFVGTIMVASAGEAAVSAVSLVDNINNLVLALLAALATGGAIIIAQNLGKGTVDIARDTAKQLLYTTVLISFLFMVIALFGNTLLLTLIFGAIDSEVMELAQTYFLITVFSYPFIAITNSISAIFRSMGISKTPMFVTLFMSITNILICSILIFHFNMGVTGAAIAALTSRVVASVAMILLIRNRRNAVYIDQIHKFKIKLSVIKDILRVGIPSSLDSGLFQIGRLVVQSLVATFGTVSIAANAVAGQIFMIIFIPGGAISTAIITIVGQCVGASDYPQAVSYTKRLVKYNYIATASFCAIAFIFKDQLLSLFNLSPEATALSTVVLTFTFIFAAIFHPLAFTLPNSLRASGDINFTMISSLLSMWIIRISMSYVLEYTLQLGLMSVWISMYTDWFARGIIFTWRYASGKWKTKRIV